MSFVLPVLLLLLLLSLLHDDDDWCVAVGSRLSLRRWLLINDNDIVVDDKDVYDVIVDDDVGS